MWRRRRRLPRKYCGVSLCDVRVLGASLDGTYRWIQPRKYAWIVRSGGVELSAALLLRVAAARPMLHHSCVGFVRRSSLVRTVDREGSAFSTARVHGLMILMVGAVLGCGGEVARSGDVPADAGLERDSGIWLLDVGADPVDVGFGPCGGEIQEGCVWTRPTAPNGQPAHLNAVSIRLRDSDGEETVLLRVDGAGACSKKALGWYVDVVDGGPEVQLVACPETCDVITSSGQQVLLIPGCVDPKP